MDQTNSIVREISFEQFYADTKNVIKPTVYIIKPWVEFLKANVKGEPVAFEITFNKQKIFTYGFIMKKVGIKMYCSPFEGWNTPYIGFYSNERINNYADLIKILYKHLRKEKRIKYFEITDKNINPSDLDNNKIKYQLIKNMNYDLTTDEETLFNKLPRNLRKKIRNYDKQGYSVIETEPNEEFAEFYYSQLIEVFELQKLKPFYSLKKVKSLFNSFANYKDSIKCFKSINSLDGSEIGTAIYLTYKDFAITFGSASFTCQKKSNMNHVVRWEAIKQFKKNGVCFFDFGGYNPYKELFQPTITLVPSIYITSIPFLHAMKCLAKRAIELRRKIFKR